MNENTSTLEISSLNLKTLEPKKNRIRRITHSNFSDIKTGVEVIPDRQPEIMDVTAKRKSHFNSGPIYENKIPEKKQLIIEKNDVKVVSNSIEKLYPSEIEASFPTKCSNFPIPINYNNTLSTLETPTKLQSNNNHGRDLKIIDESGRKKVWGDM